MVWTLAEAVRQLDREFLWRALSISLKRDERHYRLVVRFSATRHDLNTRSGVLGQARNFGSGAEAITRATKQIIDNFATPNFGAPGSKCTTSIHGSPPLADHICAITHQVIFDAASDETLSGRMMRRGLQLDGVSAISPNLKFITRDKAHGARRILSRTFKADGYVWELFDRCVNSRDSLIQIIESSLHFKSKLKEYTPQMEDTIGAKITNLHWAKHRFESMQKPLGRLILLREALQKLAQWIHHARASNRLAAKTFFVNAVRLAQRAR